MGYWDEIKNFLGAKTEETPELELTAEERRRQKDPSTLVGRFLNPKAEQLTEEELETFENTPDWKLSKYNDDAKRHPYHPELEFLKHGKDSLLASPSPLGIDENVQFSEKAIADAYRRDAIKRGVISSDEDKITQNNKIIEEIKNSKNLQNVPIRYWPSGAMGSYLKGEITINDDLEPFGAIQRIKNSYQNESQKKQKIDDILDNNLTTQIHELRHAENARNLLRNKSKWGHFIDGPSDYYGEKRTKKEQELKGLEPLTNREQGLIGLSDDAMSGRLTDLRMAALKELSSMGRRKEPKNK